MTNDAAVHVMWRRVHRRLRDLILSHVLRRGRHPVVTTVHEHCLSYLEPIALDDLFRAVRAIERDGVEGAIVEAGCGLGGSAIVMATAKSPARPLYVYDVFGIPPPPGVNDGPDAHRRAAIVANGQAQGVRGTQYYGYRNDVLGEVRASFARLGIDIGERRVHPVRGMIQDTLNLHEPIALVHIDCDRYDSVRTCLERTVPQLVPGGRLVVDDYLVWSGCRRAVDEHFHGRRGYRFTWKARLHIIRQ
jgi:asparagine synthase (glutamine-hydrolysing)